jgi:hypothetical protein
MWAQLAIDNLVDQPWVTRSPYFRPGAPLHGRIARIYAGASLLYIYVYIAHASIRQHTSAYVSIRQHTSAYVSIRQHTSAYVSGCIARVYAGASLLYIYVYIAYASIRQHTSAYVSIRQHTSAYVSGRIARVYAGASLLYICPHADVC